jgi:nucleotide-binding universal stress UspA family protein
MLTFHFKHILCPTDFSEHSAAALRVAGGIARAFGARVVVLHAQRMEVPIYFTAAQTKALRAQLRRSARTAWGFVNDFATKYLPEGVEHSVLLMEDDPVAAVLTVLRDLRAGLVVMGTHGRTGMARLRLGSVTESVLRQVSVPMLTVGPRIKPTPALGTIRRVLCPINYSDLAQTALEHAVALVERMGAELVVAHVQENPPGRAESEGKDPLRQLCDWVPAEVRNRCAVKEVVKVGTAAEQIVAEAKASHADCIVVGAQPRSFLGTILFGSTTELVIRNAPCPVLSVIRK